MRKRPIDPKLMKVLSRIAHNIGKLRHAKGWTQEETAARGDFDLRWFQRLESGRHSVSLETLLRLGHLFRVDISEFFRVHQ